MRIEDVLLRHHIPGAAVALTSGDSTHLVRTFGFANVEARQPVTPKTQFCVGSCTKSFLGLGFLMLADKGHIDLNTPVCTIAPDIPIENPWKRTEPVRIVHLLEHTAGFDDIRPSSLYNTDLAMPLRDALMLKPDLRRVRWRPGTRFAYSSPGFTLAGYVLEVLTGKRYEDYLKEKLLVPIGMRTATFRLDEVSRSLLATGYDTGNEPLPYIQGYDRPASSLNASISEMAIFVRFLLNGGEGEDGRLISDTSIQNLGRPGTTLAARAGLGDGCSYGVGVHFADGLRWLGHSGGGPGFLARYAYSPGRGFGYVVMVNKFAPEAVNEIVVLIRRTLIGEGTPPPAPVMELPPDQLQKFAGYYERRNPRQLLTEFIDVLFGGVSITREGDTLYQCGFMEDRHALYPVSATTFRLADEPDPSRVFLTDPQGNSVYATHRGYYVRSSGWKPMAYRGLFFAVLALMATPMVYALIWIPAIAYRRIRNRESESRYLLLRALPLLAVVSLVGGTVGISLQPTYLVGSLTKWNVLFCTATWLFAVLSLAGLVEALRSLSRPLPLAERVYGIAVSSACFIATLFLGYWGIIGLRTWVY